MRPLILSLFIYEKKQRLYEYGSNETHNIVLHSTNYMMKILDDLGILEITQTTTHDDIKF